MNAVDEIPEAFFHAAPAEPPEVVTADGLMASAGGHPPATPLRRVIRDATRLRCPGAGSVFAAQTDVFPRWLAQPLDWQSGLFLRDLSVISHAMRLATARFFQAEADSMNAAAGLDSPEAPAWDDYLRVLWRTFREPAPYEPRDVDLGSVIAGGGGDGPRPVHAGDLLAAAGDSTRGTRLKVKATRAARRHCPGGEDAFGLLERWAERCEAYPDDPAPVHAGIHMRRIVGAMRRGTALRFQEEADDLNAAAGTVETDRIDWPAAFARWEAPRRRQSTDLPAAVAVSPGPALRLPACAPLQLAA